MSKARKVRVAVRSLIDGTEIEREYEKACMVELKEKYQRLSNDFKVYY